MCSAIAILLLSAAAASLSYAASPTSDGNENLTGSFSDAALTDGNENLTGSFPDAALTNGNESLTDFKTSIFIGVNEIKLDKYFQSIELEELLHFFSVHYGHIMELVELGSASGRDRRTMWAARVTRMDKGSLKPKVMLVANVHGDETVGYALLVSLIQYLMYSYEVDSQIQEMLEKTDIYIVPTLNPDRLYCLEGMGECAHPPKSDVDPGSNAFGVDLDRDFLPEYFKNLNYFPDRPPQKETRNMIELIQKNQFVLSAHLRGGAIVANYPFVANYHRTHGTFIGTTTPDNEFFEKLAKDYAEKNPMMKLGTACNESFPDGVTNVSHWKKEYAYEIRLAHSYRGMQDATYTMSNCFGITLYLSCMKYPPASELPKYWYANLGSILGFLASAHQGVFGYVKDEKGYPVGDADIIVEGNVKEIKATPGGKFWRLLAPGAYNVTARAFKYATEKKSVTLTDQNRLVRHTFVLTPANLLGSVKDEQRNSSISHAVISIRKIDSNFASNVETIRVDSNGLFSSKVEVGGVRYEVMARAEGFRERKCLVVIETPSSSATCDFYLKDDTEPKIYGPVSDKLEGTRDFHLKKIPNQRFTVHGRVRDKFEGTLLEKAKVTIRQWPLMYLIDTIYTDNRGNYVARLKPGNYKLTASFDRLVDYKVVHYYRSSSKIVYINDMDVEINFKLIEKEEYKEKKLLFLTFHY